MSQNEKDVTRATEPRAPGTPAAAGEGSAPAGRYYLTITDPDNQMSGGQLTISIEVKDNAVENLTATDAEGNIYEVSFRVKRPGGQKSRKSNFSATAPAGSEVAAAFADAAAAPANVIPGGATAPASAAADGPPPGPGGNPKPPGQQGGGGGGGDDDDECQCCTLVDRRLRCQPCPCP